MAAWNTPPIRMLMRFAVTRGSLLDDAVGASDERLGKREAEGLGRLEGDDEEESRRLLDGKIGRLRTLEDLVHVDASLLVVLRLIQPIGHETTAFRKDAEGRDGRKLVLQCQLGDLFGVLLDNRRSELHECLG